jgi:hypothetical protein
VAYATRTVLTLLAVAASAVAGALWSDRVITSYDDYRDRVARQSLPAVVSNVAPDLAQVAPGAPPPLRSREHLETALL